MQTRTVALIAASVGAAAVAVTGVTYASAAGSSPQSAPAAAQAVVPAAVPFGGETGEKKGGEFNQRNERNERGERRERHERREEHGRIFVNERTYGAKEGSCVAVISTTQRALGARSFNIRNDSHKTIEFFRGATCDAGSPVATVGPRSTSNSVRGERLLLAGRGPDALVGSFRVVDNRFDRFDRFERGEHGRFDDDRFDDER
jgi:hypothetical protein